LVSITIININCRKNPDNVAALNGKNNNMIIIHCILWIVNSSLLKIVKNFMIKNFNLRMEIYKAILFIKRDLKPEKVY
jgi:hypothetical protein